MSNGWMVSIPTSTALSEINIKKEPFEKKLHIEEEQPLKEEPARNELEKDENSSCSVPENTKPELAPFPPPNEICIKDDSVEAEFGSLQMQCVKEEPRLNEEDNKKNNPRIPRTTKRSSCEHCGKIYSFTGHLIRHKRYCNNPNPSSIISCPVCSLVFKTASKLRYHMNRHNGEKPYKCNIEGCGKAFSHPTRRWTHERTCSNTVQFICNVCGASLSSDNALRIHMLIHDEPKFECHVCKKKFFQKNNLKQHSTVHAKQVPLGDSPVSNSPLVKNVERISEGPVFLQSFPGGNPILNYPEERLSSNKRKGEEYFCKFCVETFATKGKFNKHKKRCCNTSLSLSSKRRSNVESVSPIKTEGILASQQSEYNGKLDIPQIQHSIHKDQHPVNDPVALTKSKQEFTCEICCKTFRYKGKLQRHAIAHSDEWKFACDLCGMRFKWLAGYRKHLKRHATSVETAPPVEGMFECTVCGERFKLVDEYRKHEISHAQVKAVLNQYVCDVCSESFESGSHLKDHVLKSHMLASDSSVKNSSSIHKDSQDTAEMAVPVVEKVFIKTEAIEMSDNTKEGDTIQQPESESFKTLLVKTEKSNGRKSPFG